METKHNWKDEWKGMPEYINSKPLEPMFTATFKFRNEDDYNIFMEVVKHELYNDQRVFDGKQLKNKKTAWFPLDPRPSESVYVLDPNEYNTNFESEVE